MNDNELPGQRRCFCREPEDGENRVEEQNERAVKNKRGQIGDQKNFLQIKPDLRFRACADALADDRDHGKAGCLPDDDTDGVQTVGYAVCSDLGGAEQGDDGDNEDSSELEDPVLGSARDSDVENFADDGPFRLYQKVLQVDFLAGSSKE